jgi:hypothetical protein
MNSSLLRSILTRSSMVDSWARSSISSPSTRPSAPCQGVGGQPGLDHRGVVRRGGSREAPRIPSGYSRAAARRLSPWRSSTSALIPTRSLSPTRPTANTLALTASDWPRTTQPRCQGPRDRQGVARRDREPYRRPASPRLRRERRQALPDLT